MSTQETFNFNPPRLVNVPLQPLPQTVCCTLEHSGVPMSEPENITDIPPDFSWMTEMQLYDHSFEYKITHNPKDELDSYNVQNWRHIVNGSPEGMPFSPWTLLPFYGSKWWNGTVSFKFIAIKPERVTGKILIRYSFDPYDDFTKDTRYRSIAKEWDLGQSAECEFDVQAANTIRARPTWVPLVNSTTSVNDGSFLTQKIPLQEWHLGTIKIESAQRLQVGSIFPDSIRILVFRVYKNCQFYMPTDFRGNAPHFLMMGTEIATRSSTRP